MTTSLSELTLLRTLQLASPTLPVGAYAYSQGLEWAVECGWVNDEASLAQWLGEQMSETIATVDMPLLARLHRAAQDQDLGALERWNRHLLSLRETSELRADDCDRGRALARLLHALEIKAATPWLDRHDTTYATMSAIAAVGWDIPLDAHAGAYMWSWLENQVLAGVKLVPLGQVAGQRLLLQLGRRIPALCSAGLARGDDDIGGSLPLLALASSLHETQYTRLFRS